MAGQIETFKYCLSNNIIVLPIDNMARKVEYMFEGIDNTGFVILKSFFPEDTEKTIKEIKQITGLSYEPVYRVLSDLVKKKIVSEKRMGKTLVYSVNPGTYASQLAYRFYSAERERDFSVRHKIISSAMKSLPYEEIALCMIFGSYAKRKETEKSDIDLLCIYIDDKEKAESWIASIQRKYNLNIHPVIMPRTEIGDIKKDNPAFWKDIVDHGVVFKGHELLYYYAYKT